MTKNPGFLQALALAAASALALSAAPLAAQSVESVDPDTVFEDGAIDGDLAPRARPAPQPAPDAPASEDPGNYVTYSPAPAPEHRLERAS